MYNRLSQNGTVRVCFKLRVSGISDKIMVNTNNGCYLTEGYGNAEVRPERRLRLYTETDSEGCLFFYPFREQQKR